MLRSLFDNHLLTILDIDARLQGLSIYAYTHDIINMVVGHTFRLRDLFDTCWCLHVNLGVGNTYVIVFDTPPALVELI